MTRLREGVTARNGVGTKRCWTILGAHSSHSFNERVVEWHHWKPSHVFFPPYQKGDAVISLIQNKIASTRWVTSYFVGIDVGKHVHAVTTWHALATLLLTLGNLRLVHSSSRVSPHVLETNSRPLPLCIPPNIWVNQLVWFGPQRNCGSWLWTAHPLGWTVMVPFQPKWPIPALLPRSRSTSRWGSCGDSLTYIWWGKIGHSGYLWRSQSFCLLHGHQKCAMPLLWPGPLTRKSPSSGLLVWAVLPRHAELLRWNKLNSYTWWVKDQAPDSRVSSGFESSIHVNVGPVQEIDVHSPVQVVWKFDICGEMNPLVLSLVFSALEDVNLVFIVMMSSTVMVDIVFARFMFCTFYWRWRNPTTIYFSSSLSTLIARRTSWGFEFV